MLLDSLNEELETRELKAYNIAEKTQAHEQKYKERVAGLQADMKHFSMEDNNSVSWPRLPTTYVSI